MSNTTDIQRCKQLVLVTLRVVESKLHTLVLLEYCY
jgi:hypothetical protein